MPVDCESCRQTVHPEHPRPPSFMMNQIRIFAPLGTVRAGHSLLRLIRLSRTRLHQDGDGSQKAICHLCRVVLPVPHTPDQEP
ncbi:hypothetical protein HETIRDRAFT_169400 [Heterobasidion irregulare TC 32-1]|uniref:Uncharacterized protein n=1 Tax=Heterobasidion irregulare (strain TC 32-1) TaxID=747525 RepID=W4K6E8_HETIT|nr:uncharacterized protein HETIRDRAFT_169400 [Heterobasidion irregulare TC 32-1]ETW80646.1 hypothetical protein HETIRDRAFT_169400 [Heterobasidion irregulare TC 32-1]